MRTEVSGKNIDVGDALRTHVTDRIAESVHKYFDRPVDAQAVFSRDRHEFVADVSVHLSTGLTAKARARATEIYAAFEGAAERLEKQLRRYKRRLKDHHQRRNGPVDMLTAASYVLAAEDEDAEEAEADGAWQPVIVAETETPIPHLSVGEAVMQMELSGQQLLVFRNDAHGGVNVVYTREDGNIGWIDPRYAKSPA